LVRPYADLKVVLNGDVNHYLLSANLQADGGWQFHVEMKYQNDLDMDQMELEEQVEQHLMLKRHPP
jgi:hypothetical protein